MWLKCVTSEKIFKTGVVKLRGLLHLRGVRNFISLWAPKDHNSDLAMYH